MTRDPTQASLVFSLPNQELPSKKVSSISEQRVEIGPRPRSLAYRFDYPDFPIQNSPLHHVYFPQKSEFQIRSYFFNERFSRFF